MANINGLITAREGKGGARSVTQATARKADLVNASSATTLRTQSLYAGPIGGRSRNGVVKTAQTSEGKSTYAIH